MTQPAPGKTKTNPSQKEVKVLGLFMEGDGGPAKTILIVDDERAIRSLVATVLRKAGFVVLEAGSAAEAFKAAASNEIDCLITDVVLPDGRGECIAEILQKVKPQVKVVFISGYPDDRESQNRASFLVKPFKLTEVVEAVKSLTFRPA